MTALQSTAALVAILALTACTENPTIPTVTLKPQFNVNGGPEGLIHLWSGAGNARDAVGTAHGTLGYTTAFGTGVNGQAFSFDGSEEAIVGLPVDIGPGALPRMTMGMWVMLRSIVNDQGWVLGHDDYGYDRSLALTDGRYGYGVAGGTGLEPHGSPLTGVINGLDSWHCVAVAYDADASTAMFYADGETQITRASPGEGAPRATLGGLANFTDHTVDALVDEVFMYDRALTGAEIDAACDATSPPAITRFTIERATLWPVNNKLVTVASGITAFDRGNAALDIGVVVTANEEISSADWAVIRKDDGTVDVQVRAARAGGGTGRIYTINVTATDGAGNSASTSGTVTVPHDQGARAGR